ncbi:murein biosynthesis integral membrane protein MurJ [Polyangium sp. 15x6]|uniref:murein biosynthesis integral membrane protein MurJ n=1 Tax=Polyangium sp. 15x6 TaxID=3042687 RepID=UPI00249C9854|nr:murein biosynthesis integral membrane protein MurJ [Polyangium sp. 15x6]MDI3291205.1 murein biosynthesis integral membrane protein MurJ [Polyangium sp. 15x6]
MTQVSLDQPASSSEPRRGALLVAAGILLSRLVGLARQRALAHYFGTSMAAAAFAAALRIPNFLQNLFGEGVLSASFIPVYAALTGRREQEEADRVAGAVFGLLSLVIGLLTALGMIALPWLMALIAPGFVGESYELTVRLVRIAFPGTALLVFSAWCLGVLNSHRRFFLSYAAPVVWNSTIILALLVADAEDAAELAVIATWATVAGSALQFGVQLPATLRLLGHFRPSFGITNPHVRQVVRNFVPVMFARGVVQLSAYIDLAYASLLSARALAALSQAQNISLLPVSLFGMAVSAAELPAMSQVSGTASEVARAMRTRIDAGLLRIAVPVVPSAIAFLMLGDVVAAAIFETGAFRAADTRYVWYLLMGSAVGLLASTSGRLYASAFYALKDPRTPFRLAVVRVALTAALAFYSVRYLPAQLGLPRDLGGAGITASTGLVAWFEYLLLKRFLGQRIGPTGLGRGVLAKLWGSAIGAATLALGLKWALGRLLGVRDAAAAEWGGTFLMPPALHPVPAAIVILGVFGAAYFGLVILLDVPFAREMIRRRLPARLRGKT